MQVQLVAVDSSSIEKIGYRPSQQQMVVIFHSQSDILYVYDEVSYDEFLAVKRASSVGRAFKRIKDNKMFERCFDWEEGEPVHTYIPSPFEHSRFSY